MPDPKVAAKNGFTRKCAVVSPSVTASASHSGPRRRRTAPIAKNVAIVDPAANGS
ncbi:hypothetical protein [Sphingomonas hankookensis]|uniref:hypothetical protein n=1 Tax=Sphingomonas hankookensis TaxID=563996 RepID=UPI003D301DC9